MIYNIYKKSAGADNFTALGRIAHKCNTPILFSYLAVAAEDENAVSDLCEAIDKFMK